MVEGGDSFRKLCEKGLLSEALEAVAVTHQQGLTISTDQYYCLLQGCISNKDLVAGREVHDFILKSGLRANAFLCSHLIRMFAVCGSLWDANQVFIELSEPTVFTWSALITAHTKLGCSDGAIDLYHRMQQSNVKPDEHVFVAVLRACAISSALKEGKLVHMNIKEIGFELNNFVGSTLISMYAKCGSLTDAHEVFSQLQEPNLVTWNAMITGYAQHKHGAEALRLFQQMQMEGIEPDNVTFLSILKACSSIEAINQGKLMHAYISERGLESDTFVCCTLIDMYSKCGSLEVAHRLFNTMSKCNIVTWNAIITGFAQHGHSLEAFQLFEQMQQKDLEPDDVTFVAILKACSRIASLHQGKLIHVYITEQGLGLNTALCNALIDTYAKCGSLKDARAVFDKLHARNLVTWNIIIAGYSQHGNYEDTLWLHQQMQHQGIEPDSVTFLSFLKSCPWITPDQGRSIHALIVERGLDLDLSVGNTLIDMYAICENPKDAQSLFDSMAKRDVVTWNAMITGYAQTGHSREAFQLFLSMLQDGMEPDGVTCVTVLKACSAMAALDQGKLIHVHITGSGCDTDKFVGSTLIDMYVKCGSIHDADNLFNKWTERDLVTWNAIIAGYAHNGHYKLALQYFQDMQHEGLKPDDVTFLSLLSACSHLGLVEEGYQHFKLMVADHGRTPTAEHYHSIADLLGRAGLLNEVAVLLHSMPFVGDQVLAWKSLLCHCKTHGSMELGRQCFDHVVRGDCYDAVGYLLLSSIYSDAGMLKDAKGIEELRRCTNIRKKPGKALIEVDKKMHDFIVGDKSHTHGMGIYTKMKVISAHLKEEGYVPCLDSMLQPIPDRGNNDAFYGNTKENWPCLWSNQCSWTVGAHKI